MTELKGRKISPGTAKGEVLSSKMEISFYGGVEPETGKVVERGHELEGQSIKGRVLVFPQGKGSTVGSYTLYQLKKLGNAPAAIVNRECETIVAVGTIISEIPCVDKIDIEKLKNGSVVEVDADKGIVKNLGMNAKASDLRLPTKASSPCSSKGHSQCQGSSVRVRG